MKSNINDGGESGTANDRLQKSPVPKVNNGDQESVRSDSLAAYNSSVKEGGGPEDHNAGPTEHGKGQSNRNRGSLRENASHPTDKSEKSIMRPDAKRRVSLLASAQTNNQLIPVRDQQRQNNSEIEQTKEFGQSPPGKYPADSSQIQTEIPASQRHSKNASLFSTVPREKGLAANDQEHNASIADEANKDGLSSIKVSEGNFDGQKGALPDQGLTKPSIEADNSKESNFLNEDHNEEKKGRPQWKIQIARFLDHYVTTLVMGLITIYALFFDDLRIVFFPKSADDIFFGITLFGLIAYTIELFLASIAQEEYFLGFFFWLDIVSTLSMIPDCGWIWDPILVVFGGGDGADNAQDATAIAKNTRASKVTRVIRIIRLIRLIRIVKLYKQGQAAQKKREQKKDEEKQQAKLQRKRSVRASQKKQITTNSMNVMAPTGAQKIHPTSENKKKGAGSKASISPREEPIIQSSGSPKAAEGHERRSSIVVQPNLVVNEDGESMDSFDQEVDRVDKEYESSLRSNGGGNGHVDPNRSIDAGENDSFTAKEPHGMAFALENDGEAAAQPGGSADISGIDDSELNFQEDQELDIPTESRISKTLSNRTTKVVVMLVLTLLFTLPLLQLETYTDTYLLHQNGLEILVDIYNGQDSWEAYQTTLQIYKEEVTADSINPAIQISVPDPNGEKFNKDRVDYKPNEGKYESDISKYRPDEFTSFSLDAKNNFDFVIIYSTKSLIVAESIINLGRTVFVSVVLLIAAIYFQQDANKLVLNPIERMLEKVRLIAKNPLVAASDDVEMAGIMSMMHKQEGTSQKKQLQNLETTILEQAITKIGHLLALGFGEAGSMIIAQNMTQGGDLNPMMPGQKTVAIFGFCDIQNFSDSTEVLQNKVMTFVNQIAEVTHSQVNKYGGSANKNIGEAFLLVWKYPAEAEFGTSKVIKVDNLSLANRQIADMALFSFLKIIAKINKLSHILAYRQDKELNARMPDYKVKMGFGLHTGWAIEGAIGSYFKVDASYLSPNVNMASRLEAATKQYGVPLLVSGQFFSVLTPEVRQLCRKIDIVTVKGSVQPVELYTVDVCQDDLEEGHDRLRNLGVKEKKRNRDREKKDLWNKLKRHRKTTYQVITHDRDFIELRKHYKQDFTDAHKIAFDHYIAGDWPSARAALDKGLQIFPSDGPSLTLKEILDESSDGNAPAGWKGYRALNKK